MILRNYKKEYLIIAVAVFLKIVLQLMATSFSFYHGDELLYIEAGRHPAFGYMDFPPFIGFLAWVQDLFHSDSIYLNHIFNYINAALIVLFTGLLTMRSGGKSLAVSIALAIIIFSPGFAASQYLFLPTAFEQLFWLLIIYSLTGYCITSEPRHLLMAGIFAGAGLMTKYGIIFLFAGFLLTILLFRRDIIKKRAAWLSIMILLLLILPNIIWQFNNDLPFLRHFSELYKTQLNEYPALSEAGTLALFLNPVSAPIWIMAFILVPFRKEFQKYRLAVFPLFFSFLLLLVSKGKSYYFFPVILGLIPFGARFFESLVQDKRWILYTGLALIVAAGSVLLPHGVPLMKLNTYLSLYGMKPDSARKIPLPFENFYASQNWPGILQNVSDAYQKLSPEEQRKCIVWGRHYSMSGGINLLGSRYNLPSAFSFHGSCYEWVPEFSKDIAVIGISEANLQKEFWEQYFEDVVQTGVIENRYASSSDWYMYRIFLCRNPKYNSDELKRIFYSQIF